MLVITQHKEDERKQEDEVRTLKSSVKELVYFYHYLTVTKEDELSLVSNFTDISCTFKRLLPWDTVSFQSMIQYKWKISSPEGPLSLITSVVICSVLLFIITSSSDSCTGGRGSLSVHALQPNTHENSLSTPAESWRVALANHCEPAVTCWQPGQRLISNTQTLSSGATFTGECHEFIEAWSSWYCWCFQTFA